MSLVTTSWTTTRVAPTSSAPLAEATPLAPAGGVAPLLPLVLLGVGLVWIFCWNATSHKQLEEGDWP